MSPKQSKQQKTKKKAKPAKSASQTKKIDLTFESEYFTIRSIKERNLDSVNQLIIVVDPESNISNDSTRPRFEIDLDSNDDFVKSAQALRVGDIVSAKVLREGVGNGILLTPLTPFVKIVSLKFEAILASDPLIFSANGEEEAILLLDEYSSPAKVKENTLDWRKIRLPAKLDSKTKDLKAGDPVTIEATPTNYFNPQTKTNDILWVANNLTN